MTNSSLPSKVDWRLFLVLVAMAGQQHLRAEHAEGVAAAGDATVHIGIDWTETHRVAPTVAALAPWKVEFPMLAEPLWDKCRMLDELRKLGVKPPRLYEMGFPHNNCGGFCVKAGHAHFAHLYRKMPERYAFHEAKEEAFRARTGKDVSILNDRSGDGKKKPMTLRAFRERILRGDYDKHDWGGCGCSLESTPKPDLADAPTQ